MGLFGIEYVNGGRRSTDRLAGFCLYWSLPSFCFIHFGYLIRFGWIELGCVSPVV